MVEIDSFSEKFHLDCYHFLKAAFSYIPNLYTFFPPWLNWGLNSASHLNKTGGLCWSHPSSPFCLFWSWHLKNYLPGLASN
jgi:hypothetical protein